MVSTGTIEGVIEWNESKFVWAITLVPWKNWKQEYVKGTGKMMKNISMYFPLLLYEYMQSFYTLI